MPLSMPKILSSRPWLFVAGFFTCFVAVWVAFIYFAIKHQPDVVPLGGSAPGGGAAVHAKH